MKCRHPSFSFLPNRTNVEDCSQGANCEIHEIILRWFPGSPCSEVPYILPTELAPTNRKVESFRFFDEFDNQNLRFELILLVECAPRNLFPCQGFIVLILFAVMHH